MKGLPIPVVHKAGDRFSQIANSGVGICPHRSSPGADWLMGRHASVVAAYLRLIPILLQHATDVNIISATPNMTLAGFAHLLRQEQ
jgi:hypothetical protein